MKQRKMVEFGKNAVGTVFLLAAAFFVCSTFMSIKTVFADPIAPVATPTKVTPTSQRTSARNRTVRTSNRVDTGNKSATTARSVTPRTTSPRTTANTINATTSRRVTSRGTTRSSRNVVARTAVAPNASRVSLTGTGIRASVGNSYNFLSNKLYTGNYSNIIDSTTGLISADAYSTCLESYYTCMDEICTARSDTKGRCSCAGRATNFMAAEEQLELANEELINLSGQLALLVATKGKDVSSAFQLTDAEKVMNCVSWKDMSNQYKLDSDDAIAWCNNHGIYLDTSGNAITSCAQPSYCSSTGNNFSFDISKIDGSSSDILASLQAWAAAKDSAKLYKANDDESILSAVSNVTSALVGLNISFEDTQEKASLDSLANTWGYELFEYAHNNVCGRVLDSCFNGIYEACGTPPSVTESDGTKHAKCQNGQSSSCPYNFNSYIAVDSKGDVALNERGSTNADVKSSASCFGYSTSTSSSSTTDPYASLRGPVADARRSIMQKYLLDANAACDAYGSALQQTAQNIAYQKVAARQALQQKRLEFVQQEESAIASAYSSAISNMNECLSELYDCYTTQETANTSWSTSRIKTYCMQISNVPHCYETMVCGTPGNVSTLQAVIDKADSDNCNASNVYSENTCRNVVTISEVLSGSYVSDISTTGLGRDSSTSKDSRKYREQCLQNIGIEGVRNWTRTGTGTNWPDNN